VGAGYDDARISAPPVSAPFRSLLLQPQSPPIPASSADVLTRFARVMCTSVSLLLPSDVDVIIASNIGKLQDERVVNFVF